MKKLITMMLMMASVFFFACSEDSEDKLSKDVAKTEITQVSTDLSAKLTEMTETEGMVAMGALMSMPDPFVSTTKSNEKFEVLNNIQKYLLPYNYVKKSSEKSAFDADPFDFDTYVGTYTYHNTPFPYWEIVPGGDKIVITFPSDTSHLDVNDAVLTLYNYDEILLDGDYLPTDIKADLYISETKVIDIDLTVVWFENGENIAEPTSLDAKVYLIPFEFTGNFVNTSTAASIDFAISYENAQFFSVGVGAAWENAGDSIPSNINGYLQIFEVKLQADVDLNNILKVITDFMGGTSDYATVDEALAAVNKEIDAYVTVDGTWAAEIEIALVPLGEDDFNLDIVFVYADGSSESAIPYFEDLSNELDVFFGELEEYYGNW